MAYGDLEKKFVDEIGTPVDMQGFIKDSDDMVTGVTDEDAEIPTQQSAKVYIDANVLVGETYAVPVNDKVYSRRHSTYLEPVASEAFPDGVSWAAHSGAPADLGSNILVGDGVDGSDIKLLEGIVLPNEITMSAWVRTSNNAQGSRTIMSAGNSDASKCIDFGITGVPGVVSGGNFDAAPFDLAETGSGGLANNVWTLITMTIAANGDVNIYTNGGTIAGGLQDFEAGSITIDGAVERDLIIFSRNALASSFLGDIGRVEFVNYVMTAQQVADQYNEGEGRSIRKTIGEAVYDGITFAYVWDLNEGSDGVIDGRKFESFHHKTLTDDSTLYLMGMKKGQQATAYIDGPHTVDFVPTPSAHWKQATEDRADGKISKYEVYCVEDATDEEQYLVKSYERLPNTDILQVWEFNEGSGTSTSTKTLAHAASVPVAGWSNAGWLTGDLTNPGIVGGTTLNLNASQIDSPTFTNGDTLGFTISCWSSPHAINTTQQAILYVSTGVASGNNRIIFTMNINGVAGQLGILVPSWDNFTYISGTNFITGVTANEWHHQILTCRPDGTASMYIDGVSTQEFTYAYADGTREFTFGAAPNGTVPYDGELGLVSLYQGGITDQQALMLYNGGTGNSIMNVLANK